MAKVLLKKSSVSSNAPGTGDLDYGELAINYADGRLYYKNSSNQIKNFVDSDTMISQIVARVAGITDVVQDTTPQLGGDLETNGNNITFGDNDKALFGAGSDLQIYHDGTHSYIVDNGTGNLKIRTQGDSIRLETIDGGRMLLGIKDAEVRLYYNDVEKFATDSTGVDVTGNITVSGTVDGRDIATDGTKLDGIEANAKDDQTITAGNGLTGGGTGDVTLNIGAGTGITVNANDIAIGQDVATTANVTFASTHLTPVGAASAPSYSEGTIWYSSDSKTLQAYSADSAYPLSFGEREFVRCRNNTGSTILKGTPVYVTGVHIPGHPIHGHHPTIAVADASDPLKYNVIGLAGEDIADADHGYVTVRGWIQDIDTSHLTPGSRVHLGFATPGTIVDNAPTYPNYPTDLGICLTSDSAGGGGSIYIDIAQHSYESLRVLNDIWVGGDITISGNLTVNGTQSVVSQANLSVDTSFIYTNSGNTIDTTNFTGSGLNDATFGGHYKGLTTKTFYVRIDGVGTGTGGVDTFEWSLDNFSTTEATGIDITGEAQALGDNITVTFIATTGHTSGDKWDGTAAPVNVDAGFASNRNTGTSGVGYTHMGMFFDVTDEKWKLFKSYDPEPEGTINTSDASYEKATLDANLTGNVTGNLTGNVTGNASTATTLATSRNFSASGDASASNVAFNGSGNVNLALTLATVNANVGSFGSSSTVPAITVNGKGLVTAVTSTNIDHDALTNFVANEHIDHSIITLTAGNGLTGGGTIEASVSFAVGAGVGIKVSADAVSIDSAEIVNYQTPIHNLFSASGDLSYSNGQFSFSETYSTANELLTAIKTVDGATSGLDADLLDGQHGSYYRINVYDASGTLLN